MEQFNKGFITFFNNEGFGEFTAFMLMIISILSLVALIAFIVVKIESKLKP